MKPFRKHHLCQILNSFENATLPMDLHLARYFKEHHALGSSDRAEISDILFAIIRRKGYLTAQCPRPDWQKRLDLWEKWHEGQMAPFMRFASAPKSFIDALCRHYGEEGCDLILQALEERAPATIRVNPMKISRDQLFDLLKKDFKVKLSTESPLGIDFIEKAHLFSLDAFQKGFFEMQDASSQTAALMVDAKPKDWVLDFCAGSGGKTLGFAHKLEGKGQIFLHDIRKEALDQAKKRCARAGLQNVQFKHDLSTIPKGMDWIFVDAPCSGSGTWRRNPDQKWKFTPAMIEELVEKQRMIFEKALCFLKPKGKIIYATCSLLAEENEEQVDYFLATHGLQICSPPFKRLPMKDGADGFFAVTLERKS